MDIRVGGCSSNRPISCVHVDAGQQKQGVFRTFLLKDFILSNYLRDAKKHGQQTRENQTEEHFFHPDVIKEPDNLKGCLTSELFISAKVSALLADQLTESFGSAEKLTKPKRGANQIGYSYFINFRS